MNAKKAFEFGFNAMLVELARSEQMEKQAMMGALGRAMGRGAGHAAEFMTKARRFPLAGMGEDIRSGYNAARGRLPAERPPVFGSSLETPAGAPGGAPRDWNPDQEFFDQRWQQLHPSGVAWSRDLKKYPHLSNPDLKNVKGMLSPGSEYENASGINAGAHEGFKPGSEYENMTGINAGMSGGHPDLSLHGLSERFRRLSPAQRWGAGIGAGYGAVTAATAPATMANNRMYDLQQEHPILSWLGQHFAGMPKMNHKNYLVPSFLQ